MLEKKGISVQVFEEKEKHEFLYDEEFIELWKDYGDQLELEAEKISKIILGSYYRVKIEEWCEAFTEFLMSIAKDPRELLCKYRWLEQIKRYVDKMAKDEIDKFIRWEKIARYTIQH